MVRPPPPVKAARALPLTLAPSRAAPQEALRVRRSEAKQVELVSREVRQAREEEERALERMQEQASMEREYWAKNLRERRAIAKKREDMRNWFEARKQKDADISADAAGDLDDRQEAMLRLKATSMHMRGEVMSKGMDELREAIQYHASGGGRASTRRGGEPAARASRTRRAVQTVPRAFCVDEPPRLRSTGGDEGAARAGVWP